MKNNQLLLVSIATLVLIAAFFAWGLRDQKKGTTNSENLEMGDIGNKPIYFYGQGCPHCQELAKFIDDNGIAEKVDFLKLEVWSDRKNNRLMQEKVEECGLKKEEAGVPLVYAQGKCYVGSDKAEEYFRREAGMP